jgi:hypothetical protein
MAVLPLRQSYEELRLTVASAEIVLPSLTDDDEIMLSCDISSLPTHNCTVACRRSQAKNKLTGQMFFQSSRPLVTAKIGLDCAVFEKLKLMCFRGEPVRPITLYLKMSKSREISNGEINISTSDFTLNIFDLSWRHPLF